MPVNWLGPPFVLITLLTKEEVGRATGVTVADAIMAEASAGLMVIVLVELVDATAELLPRTSEPRVWG